MTDILFQFTPNELNKIVYQIQKHEKEYMESKDAYEILDDSAKDVLASIKAKISSSSDVSDAKSEMLARASNDWKSYKEKLYEAKKKQTQDSLNYKHSLRVMEVLISGMSFEKEKLKRGI